MEDKVHLVHLDYLASRALMVQEALLEIVDLLEHKVCLDWKDLKVLQEQMAHLALKVQSDLMGHLETEERLVYQDLPDLLDQEDLRELKVKEEILVHLVRKDHQVPLAFRDHPDPLDREENVEKKDHLVRWVPLDLEEDLETRVHLEQLV